MVRHGQAEAAWHESPDPGLSELGRQQALQAAQQLSHLNNIAIVSSPLLRCQQTAQPFAEAKNTPIRIHQEVSEIPLISLLHAQAGSCSGNHQLLNFRLAHEDGVNVGVLWLVE